MRSIFILLALTITATIFNANQAMAQQNLKSSSDQSIERFKNWSVLCNTSKDGMKSCQLSQELMTKKNKQRALAVVITKNNESKKLIGTIVAPFGIKIADGISLLTQDNKKIGEYNFITCLPQGCIATFDFDDNMVAKFKADNKVMTVMTVLQNNKKIAVDVSLSGFSKAFGRFSAVNGQKN